MSDVKTKASSASVEDFIATVEDPTRRQDSFTLLELYKKATGEPAKMWGTSIIGFGQYHYKSERSSQEADWPLAGFSPRKQNLTLYIMAALDNYSELMHKLGKHKTSKACVYITKLADVDMQTLETLIKKSYEDAKASHEDSKI